MTYSVTLPVPAAVGLNLTVKVVLPPAGTLVTIPDQKRSERDECMIDDSLHRTIRGHPGFRVERGIKRRQMSRRYRCRFLPWVQQIRKLYPELIRPNFNEIRDSISTVRILSWRTASFASSGKDLHSLITTNQ